QVDEQIFAQFKQLYLIFKKLDMSSNEIKTRLDCLERYQEEQENDLSIQVIDISIF
ncbi:1947_t:CDS:1, partial [Racocetra persica]